MKARKYIKNIILECLEPEGSSARELVDEVTERVGKPFSVSRVASYLSKMFEDGVVRRVPEKEGSRYMRYRWFKN